MARDPSPLSSPLASPRITHPHPFFKCSLHHLIFAHHLRSARQHQLETPSHSLCTFETIYTLTGLLRMSTPGEQDQGEPEQAPNDQNGLAVIRNSSTSQPPLCSYFDVMAEEL
jgi:hypothetical protein